MTRRLIESLTAALLLFAFASCASIEAGPSVVIDGSFDDWEATPPVTVDPKDAPDGFIDFGTVKVRHDRDAVYLMVDVDRVVTAQRLPGTVSLLLDVDGDAATGHAERGMQGVDVVLEFPLPNEKAPGTPGAGVRIRALTNGHGGPEPINAYSVGFVLAPVHAASTLEMRIDRRGPIGPTPPLFQSQSFKGKFLAVDLEGRFVDETDVFTHRLGRVSRKPERAEMSEDPLRRLEGTDLRITFWNVSRSAYLERPEPFARVLSAIGADIIVLDEVPPTTSADEVARFLHDAFITDSWNVYFSEGGDDQRTVIASRSPLQVAEPFRRIPWSDHDVETLVAMSDAEDAEAQVRKWLRDSVPTGGVVMSVNDRTLLVVGVDMQCCGGYETPQDRRRMIEAEAINRAIRETLATTRVHGVIVGGDFNLVGDPAVLAITGSQAAPDGQSLQRVRALQLDGLTDATWANPDEPFVPGRLDNVLYSAGSLEVRRAFVFDSSDLTRRWQAWHGVRPGDSADSSDHFPVVVDFGWITEPRAAK
jgi:endonuclease/exonuclease/phosphatase family metal-dependent hydrolase